MGKYAVTYEKDESGWWQARLHGVAGVHSDGRTVSDARARVREALALALGDAEAERSELVDEVKLPTEIRRLVARATSARARLEQVKAEAQESTVEAVRTLRATLGLSRRDIADLLGISHQRVQQLARGR